MGRRFRAFLKRMSALDFGGNDNRCPACQKYFITGRRGVQAHLSNDINIECYNWVHTHLESDSSDSSFGTNSDSSESVRAVPFEVEGDHNVDTLVDEAPLHVDGRDDFDFDNLPPMEFTEEELHPRAEPRTHDNYSVKHPTAGAAFGRGLTILEDIRLNDRHAMQREGNIYYPFASEMDWEVGMAIAFERVDGIG